MRTGKPKQEMVTVEYHVSVRVPKDDTYYVKEWMERFGYLLGDGWAFEQNVSEWITIDGKREW